MREVALFKEVSVTATNRIVIKSFFRITWFVDKKIWAHSHHFKSIVEALAVCGGKKLKSTSFKHHKIQIICHLINISNYIQIMDDHIQLPLFASFRSSGSFTSFTDEISDVTTTEQLVIYAAFNHQGTIKKYFYKQDSWKRAKCSQHNESLD